MLNLKYTTERIIEKLKCYFANRISKYIEAKDYGFFCERDKVKKELLELRRMIFLIENVEDCDLTGLERKVDELMATINNNNCLNDDCIKQSVIEQLIDNAINTALEDYTPTEDLEIKTVKVSVTSGQILSLNSIPIELVPAPGAGFVLDALHAMVRVNAATPYVGDDVIISSVPGAAQLSLLNPLGTGVTTLNRMTDAGIIASYIENTSLKLSVINADPTGGTGTLDVYLAYRIITL